MHEPLEVDEVEEEVDEVDDEEVDDEDIPSQPSGKHLHSFGSYPGHFIGQFSMHEPLELGQKHIHPFNVHIVVHGGKHKTILPLLDDVGQIHIQPPNVQ